MNKNADRIILQDIARNAMISRGLVPDFPDVEISVEKSANGYTHEIQDWRNF